MQEFGRVCIGVGGAGVTEIPGGDLGGDEGFVEAADVAQDVAGGLADGGVFVGFQPAEQRDRLVRVLVVVVIRNRRSSCDGRIASRQ